MDIIGKQLVAMYARNCKGWRFNRKYWNKVAWYTDPVSLLRMLDYTQNAPHNSHWHSFYKAAKARGLVA